MSRSQNSIERQPSAASKRWLLIVAVLLSGCFIALCLAAVLGGALATNFEIVSYCLQGDFPEFDVFRCPSKTSESPALQPGLPQQLNPDARPFIVDTDMAPDDWMAILYLLQRPDVDVKAITVTGTGEAHCDPGIQNVRNLAALAGRPEIPVACGSETPLAGTHAFPESWRDNADKMAGLSLPDNEQPVSSLDAVQLLTGAILEAEADVTIVTLGPLTNLAELFQSDPALVEKLEMIYVMGGAFKVPGNVGLPGLGIDNEMAEWNIYVDPQAAAQLLESGAPLTFVPLDATNQAPVTLSFYERLATDRQTPAAEFVFQQLTQQRSQIINGGYYFWDPLAAVISNDERAGKIVEMPVSVMADEGPESGATQSSEAGVMARVAVDADRELFEQLFLDALNGRTP